MSVLEQAKTRISKEQLASLYQLMKDHQDDQHANKILDLVEKLSERHFHVSFTGHFSAGKSSIINFLLGKDLLPKSPIPTSANIVKITSGAGVARVFFNEKPAVEYAEPYDIDMIKDYCTTKGKIDLIEIHTSEPIIPKNSFMVDTPGIDAADDADRFMTESSLHLVDVLYYVMDYNHVQSEINFTFLKQIQDKGIPIYIIINQIDKHNDNELSFSQFKESVENSFNQWAIQPEKIYYSSVMDLDNPHNDLHRIKVDLFHLLEAAHDIDLRVEEACKEILGAHKEFLQKEVEGGTDRLDAKKELEEWEAVQEQINLLESSLERLEVEVMDEVEQTLKNAYLMPAKVRDTALAFLESQDPAFKVGFFQSKKKTAEAKEARLQAFYQEVEQSMQSTIIWKLREKFAQFLQNYEIASDQLRKEAQDFSISFTEEELFNSLKKGATVNGQYVLNYTNELSNKIKQAAKQAANRLLEAMKASLQTKVQAQLTPLKEKAAELALLHERALEQVDTEEEIKARVKAVDELMDQASFDPKHLQVVMEELERKHQYIQEELTAEDVVGEFEQATEETKETTQASVAQNETVKEYQAEQIISSVDQAIGLIRDLADFEGLVADLVAKKSRIENRNLTIALFGAFSAGKSSFSNALLGSRMLPVSPNPTTAVINRIRPATGEYTNGSVVITYKSDAVLTEDLKTITRELEPEGNNFFELVDWIKREKIYEHDQLSQVYQSYLNAIINGFDSRSNWLGKEEQIHMEAFADYVTDESIAAYIEAVDLYHDNELTNRGITLVDTPGANSVNARHTNVAFDYIKDADAIIYVTYYNHAVTSADRDFLMQLGRVKESFELDKMFFIVNAADLAKDEEELHLVVNYVEDQLLQYGIRNPQIYPLSSKTSLAEKEKGLRLNDQMRRFEEAFNHFTKHDLHALTYEAAIWDIHRVKSRLETVIETAQLDQKEKEERIKQLQDKREESIQLIEALSLENITIRTVERIERQLHYVKERVFIRFHDMFQEHFNPTTITENGRQAYRQLEANRNRFVDYLGYELLQEVRAVSIRLEAFMNRLLKEQYEGTSKALIEKDESIRLANFEEVRFESPSYEQAFQSINMAIFDSALRMFRNLRSFFEQNEREAMKDEFYAAIEAEIDHYIQEQERLMKTAYQDQLDQQFHAIRKAIIEELNTIISQQVNVLNCTIDHKTYSKILDQINVIVDNL